jgi:hypothetical protein
MGSHACGPWTVTRIRLRESRGFQYSLSDPNPPAPLACGHAMACLSLATSSRLAPAGMARFKLWYAIFGLRLLAWPAISILAPYHTHTSGCRLRVHSCNVTPRFHSRVTTPALHTAMARLKAMPWVCSRDTHRKGFALGDAQVRKHYCCRRRSGTRVAACVWACASVAIGSGPICRPGPDLKHGAGPCRAGPGRAKLNKVREGRDVDTQGRQEAKIARQLPSSHAFTPCPGAFITKRDAAFVRLVVSARAGRTEQAEDGQAAGGRGQAEEGRHKGIRLPGAAGPSEWIGCGWALCISNCLDCR